MLVEGVRAVEEVLATDAEVVFAVVSPRLAMTEGGRRILGGLSASDGRGAGAGEADSASRRVVEVVDVEDEELPGLAGTEQPQGVLLVCEEPEWDVERLPDSGRVLVLDAIQDPGNVGTLIRSAAAFGFDAVIALDGTGDPWGAKAVRASAGSVFRLPVGRVSCGEALVALDSNGWRILAAAAEGVALRGDGGDGPGRTGRGAGKVALVLGNEGAGVRDEVRRAASETVAVRMSGQVESLNVGIAGSILMHELTREDV